MGGDCNKYQGGERRGAYMVLVVKSKGKKPLGRPRNRWEDNVKIDLQEVGWVCLVWIDMSPDRGRWRALVNAVRNL